MYFIEVQEEGQRAADVTVCAGGIEEFRSLPGSAGDGLRGLRGLIDLNRLNPLHPLNFNKRHLREFRGWRLLILTNKYAFFKKYYAK
ncbi:MAG: hypothetical protein H6566_27475 [Lewinellaceae bacterium]|nr:hypothetical protein [Lewinellaceae bacterium]